MTELITPSSSTWCYKEDILFVTMHEKEVWVRLKGCSTSIGPVKSIFTNPLKELQTVIEVLLLENSDKTN